MVSNIFYFHPYLGKWSDLTNISQMGWNHQLDITTHLKSQVNDTHTHTPNFMTSLGWTWRPTGLQHDSLWGWWIPLCPLWRYCLYLGKNNRSTALEQRNKNRGWLLDIRNDFVKICYLIGIFIVHYGTTHTNQTIWDRIEFFLGSIDTNDDE